MITSTPPGFSGSNHLHQGNLFPTTATSQSLDDRFESLNNLIGPPPILIPQPNLIQTSPGILQQACGGNNPHIINLLNLPNTSGICTMEGATLNGLTQVTLENGISAIHGSVEETNSARSSPSAGTGSGSNGSVSGYENKLFVGGLSWQTTPEKLRDYFSQFGPVTDVLVMKDPITQRSRGFGFITFNDSGTVPRVLGVPVHMLDGKRIDPKHATPRSKSGSNKTKKVFVGGVSQETSVEEVKAYFSQFGKVEEAVMLMDQQTKRHRGFGFVTFDSEDVVDRICEIHFHTIKGKKVECKKAQPKETVASLNLLAKRMVLPLTAASSLAAQGMHALHPTSLGGVQMAPAVAAAAAANYSKLLGAGLNYPSIGNYRYTPYQLPSLNAANSNAIPSLSATQAYGAYALPTSVDMSGLQNLDWSGVYNAYV